jgi:hypothetical protein
MQEEINHGVLIAEPKPEDYIAGENSPLIENPINESADNRPYKPGNEKQSGLGGDKMTCVTASSGGCIETTIKMQIVLGLLKPGQKDFLDRWKFIDEEGNIRISTRWAAIQNGTTENGNYAAVVAQWWRDNGFIPEWMLPNDQTLSREQYFNKDCLTDEMKKCADESKEFFRINYEWVTGDDSNLKKALTRGSVQILTSVCSGWNNGEQVPVPGCGLPVQHATELLFVDEAGIKHIFDTYDPFNKKLALDYNIPYRMLYLINQTKNMTFKKETGKPNVYLVDEIKKTKILIIDMPTLEVLKGNFSEVPNLNDYAGNGTLIWTERLIN